jgi:hypothetical protein
VKLNAEFLQTVKSAVRHTVAAVRRRHPLERLVGYALLTDDELVTLTYMAVTAEAVTAGAGEDLLFSPTDWPYEYEYKSFDLANQQLRQLSASGEFSEHVERAFATLVQALVELRAEGIFGPNVFLSVLSTDPSPHLLALENACVERLNCKDVVEARQRFLDKWAR